MPDVPRVHLSLSVPQETASSSSVSLAEVFPW